MTPCHHFPEHLRDTTIRSSICVLSINRPLLPKWIAWAELLNLFTKWKLTAFLNSIGFPDGGGDGKYFGQSLPIPRWWIFGPLDACFSYQESCYEALNVVFFYTLKNRICKLAVSQWDDSWLGLCPMRFAEMPTCTHIYTHTLTHIPTVSNLQTQVWILKDGTLRFYIG